MRDSLLKKVLEPARRGDVDSFERLYILTYKEAYRHAASFIKEPSDIWRVLANVYIKLYEDKENLPAAGEMLRKIYELTDEIASDKLEEEAIYSDEPLSECEISEEKAATVLSIIEERTGMVEKEPDHGRTRDYVFSGVRALAALGVVALAVFVLNSGIKKVQSYNSKIKYILNDTTISTLAESTQFESSDIAAAATEQDDQTSGLKNMPDGKKYLEEDLTYLKNSWKEADGSLYYFGENEYAETGDKVIGDQVFSFGQDGALMTIGRMGNGAIGVVDSIQTVGGKTYYLKEDKESEERRYHLYRTDDEEKKENRKELIISNIQDYLIVGDMVYYMQDRTLQKRSVMDDGYAKEELKTEVIDKNDAFYLVNELEEPVTDESGTVDIENRTYRVEEDGRIKYVKPAVMETKGVTYYFNGSTPQTSRGIFWKYSNGVGDILAEEGYWIDSFCLVDDWIYYSAYVGKADGYNRYSQLYRISTDGTKKEVLSEVFKGNMMNLYYYKEKKEIYGEYRPGTDNNYGRLVAISLTGQMELINDSASRVGESTTGEDTLELIMVSGDTVSCYWHDCDWYGDGGVKILWTKPIELSASDRIPLQ